MSSATREFAIAKTRETLRAYIKKIENARGYFDYLSQEGREIVEMYDNNTGGNKDLLQQACEDDDFFFGMTDEMVLKYADICYRMNKLFDLKVKNSYPIDKLVADDTANDIAIIEKTLQELWQHGDSQIQKAISEYRNGKRAIRFDKMPQNQLGQTNQTNGFYCHSISDKFIQDTPENAIQLAITLAHEFKRNAVTNTLEGETRDIVLSDTKIIESFANTHGEEIYKKFPEYGILHYIKKIFGEEELKNFADYAFDSTSSYWKVNEVGDLIDDGNSRKVFDANGKELYSADSGGLQTTLEDWLKNNGKYPKINAFETLMKPAGYAEYDGTTYEWKKNPKKIEHNTIKTAYESGQITEDQYYMIQLARCISDVNDEKSSKLNLFKNVLNDLQKSRQGTMQADNQVTVDIAMSAYKWLEKMFRRVKNIFSSANNSHNSTETNNQKEKVKTISETNRYYKLPQTLIGIFSPKMMEGFQQEAGISKCNKFLGAVVNNLPIEIAKKILPDGVKLAEQLYQDWRINPNLECINPKSHFDSNRDYSQLVKDAGIAAQKANDMANNGYLVLAASPKFDGYSDHVSCVISQDNEYIYDADTNDINQTCFLNTNGYLGHQGRKTPEVLRDYPVFLQAGTGTGIVPPGWAFSRSLFNNDKVDYYVVKN